MWVKAIPGKGPNGKPGILVETEMEKFQCVQCGHCSRILSDAYSTSVDMEDINRWKREDPGTPSNGSKSSTSTAKKPSETSGSARKRDKRYIDPHGYGNCL